MNDLERMVEAWKLANSDELAAMIYNRLQDVPGKIRGYPRGWATGEAWFIFHRVLKKYDKQKSKKGFRSYFMQCLTYRCKRSWGNENVIFVPVNQRSKVKMKIVGLDEKSELLED